MIEYKIEMKLRSLIFGLIVVCSPFVAFGPKNRYQAEEDNN